VEAAKKTFDDAQKAYDNAVNAVDDAQRTLDRAKKDLTRAKDDAVKAASDKLDAANKAQVDAQRAYEKAMQDRSRAITDNKDSNKKKIASAEKALLDAQKQLESAENSVKNAENALNQAQAKQGSAGSDVELRELTLDKLNRQLAGGQIVAESRGVITAVNAEVGAAPSGALFVIDSKDALYVSARVKEYNLKTLFVGQEIIITTDATGSKKFSATLSYISPKAVSEAGSTSVEFEVRATFHPTESADFAGTPITDPDEAIKIGMNAFLDIVTDAKENVYAVPVSAIITNEKGSFVYAAPEEPSGGGRKPKQVPEPLEIPVTLGLKTSTSVEISGAGLKDGLQILTDLESKLSNGQPKGGIMGMGV
jgi:multidrug efflux pump subunit AcrA (membrane-fusion protein)